MVNCQNSNFNLQLFSTFVKKNSQIWYKILVKFWRCKMTGKTSCTWVMSDYVKNLKYWFNDRFKTYRCFRFIFGELKKAFFTRIGTNIHIQYVWIIISPDCHTQHNRCSNESKCCVGGVYLLRCSVLAIIRRTIFLKKLTY